MASLHQAASFLQLFSLPRTAGLRQTLYHWKGLRKSDLQTSAQFFVGANSRESDEKVTSTGVNKPDNEVSSEVTELDTGKEERKSHNTLAQDEGISAKKYGVWKRGSKVKEGEEVILKVLPRLGEPKALKFRLGKKHVTMDSVREKNLTSEDLTEPDDSLECGKIIGDLPKSKNMDGEESEATLNLVQSLRKKLSLSDKDQSLYSNASPSIFGTTVGGAKEVAVMIKRAGFKKKEVGSVLPKFPNILDVNYDNVARVYKVLQKEYKMNRKWLQGLMRRHPFLFMLEEKVVRERMDSLVELGLHSREISEAS